MVEIFGEVKIDWLGKRKIFFGITAFLILIGGISLLRHGTFNYGVDFKGGTIMDVQFPDKPDVERIRTTLRNGGAGDASIQGLVNGAGVSNEVLIEVEDNGQSEAGQGRELITKALDKDFAGKYTVRSAESVGPKVGADLRHQAVMATLYALGGMLVYIAFRFEWIYGAAAVFAALHDTLMTLGFFSLFNREINLTVIAALLTLIGYSMNDTIVVFDRVRENLRTRRRDNLEMVMNDSINQTLSRTILTSGLTFMTVLALFIFGGEVINHFAFAMVVGIIVGTYSSIAIASPLVLIYSNMRERAAGLQVAQVKVAKPPKAK